MLRHPDSERHVSSYTTLVPSRRTTENSCSECVSGLLAAFHLYGRPLVVSRLFAAPNDVGEVLRGAGALFEVRHMVRGEVREDIFIFPSSLWIGIDGERVSVAFGIGGVAAEVSDSIEFSGILSVRGVEAQAFDCISLGDS